MTTDLSPDLHRVSGAVMADVTQLVERSGTGEPGSYLGAAAQFIDVALARVPEGGPQHG
jgi:hypothetical protein